jgi:hypothetical protein
MTESSTCARGCQAAGKAAGHLALDRFVSGCADMVQAMGEGLHLQTGQPGDSSDADEDGFSSDSDLHEQLLFDEEPAKPQASKAAPNLGPASSGTR